MSVGVQKQSHMSSNSQNITKNIFLCSLILVYHDKSRIRIVFYILIMTYDCAFPVKLYTQRHGTGYMRMYFD